MKVIKYNRGHEITSFENIIQATISHFLIVFSTISIVPLEKEEPILQHIPFLGFLEENVEINEEISKEEVLTTI